ncbi:NB-ARC domain-containing protein [Nostoc sp. 'Peltigera membranacea cyanobiont' N6]|uniref:WD40 domain-containing protein n=1 Tax=Nostoc sp. 'Peltigera membranacea cyanobiont' N6 TaxID=1261031 RepID=UPI000CF30F3C|nr:NB-ARC domain-containing protein [Nostoc sp. 'Peltigera membranacea cyanobiont' N6]AVH65688.1 WD40 repeat-containing protein [Nostoc sp. 'Peltigera membranacea cyanobiont' N6]
MTLQNWRRKRGVALTSKGLQKIKQAKHQSEAKENFGNRYTLEEMSALSGLYSATISKVLNREGGVDKQTIEKLFSVFQLKIDKSDYSSSNNRLDWGEAIFNSVFYGRIKELTTLEQWILNEHCRLVALLGIGGIGKTALSVKLAQQIQDNFEYVIWRSLREAPPVKIILSNLIQFLSDEQETESNLPESFSDRVSRLLYYLQNHRCLVILDNAESILRSGSRAGLYREGYEEYGELLRRIGEGTHQSCLILTSREKPKEVALLEGQAIPVRSLPLSGLKVAEGQEILKLKGLSAVEDEWKVMIERYAGNPLALKIVATTIQDIFGGNVTEFLQQDTAVFGDIRDVLEQQFERLSDLEKDIMYWLAINRESLTLSELRDDIISPVAQSKLLEAVESLGRRSLIEKATPTLIDKTGSFFTLQPVVMEYVTNSLIEQVCEEIVTQNIDLFRSKALTKATAKEYVRDTQISLIIKPVIDGLLTAFRSKKNLENHLAQILATLREISPLEQSYTAGNVFNLLCSLETDLSNYDFSYLTIWQADLQNVKLHNANFARAHLAKCVFIETFGGIFSVAFSPDGKLLATGDTNGEIRLYEVANSQQLMACKGHTGWVWSVTFSPDGKVLASGSNDQTIKLWDISTGQCLKTFEGHIGGVRSVTFSPDNQVLASGSDDQTVKLWNISTGKCFKTLQENGCSVWSVAFNPKGDVLASGNDDYKVRLWDINSNSCIHTLEGHTQWVYSVTFSPDGNTLASASHDQTVKLWDTNTGKCIKTLQGHTDLVHSVTFSVDGSTLVSCGEDQTVKVWDFVTGQCLKTLQGHKSRVWSLAICINQNICASSSDDQTVKLWNISTGRCIKTFQGYNNGIWSVAVSPNDNFLASGSNDQTVTLWDAMAGKCLKTLQGHDRRVTSVVFSPDSQLLASGSEDQTIRIWDINNSKCLKILKGHSNRVTSVTFSADSYFLASGSDDQTIRIWDITTGQCLNTLREHSGRTWSVTFSPDSHVLASGSHDGTVKLWDIRISKCLHTLQGHTEWVWAVGFSSDGGMLASGSGDQTIKIWDVTTGQCLRTLQGHTNTIYSVAFSSDGRILASGSGDQTVKLWDVSTGRCLRTLLGHTRWVWSVTFSSDGQTVVSCSEDETIKIWDVQTGECLKTLKSKNPYEGMNITSISGLTDSQKDTLKALGAVEY